MVSSSIVIPFFRFSISPHTGEKSTRRSVPPPVFLPTAKRTPYRSLKKKKKNPSDKSLSQNPIYPAKEFQLPVRVCPEVKKRKRKIPLLSSPGEQERGVTGVKNQTEPCPRVDCRDDHAFFHSGSAVVITNTSIFRLCPAVHPREQPPTSAASGQFVPVHGGTFFFFFSFFFRPPRASFHSLSAGC